MSLRSGLADCQEGNIADFGVNLDDLQPQFAIDLLEDGTVVLYGLRPGRQFGHHALGPGVRCGGIHTGTPGG